MIIWGFRGRWSQRRNETGEFFCQRCGGDRTWVLTVLRRWFTLFFIPLFPVGSPKVEAIQCTTCQTRFDRDVLHTPTASVLTTELQGSMRLATAAVVRAAGGAPSQAALDAVRGQGLVSYDDAALAHDIATLDVSSLDDHLTYLAGALSLQGREQFLATLAGVARAGAAGAARPALEQIGRGLGLSAPHVAGVLSAPTGAARPPADSPWPAPPSSNPPLG